MHFPPAGNPACRTLPTLCFSVLCAVFVAFGTARSLASDSVDYRRDVKALLKERCFACHGALQQQGDLRLDSGDLIRRGGDSGSAIVPGAAASSLLVERIADPNPESRMPPEGEPLTAAQIEAVRRWIDQGAVTPDDDEPEQDPRLHWAFQPIVRPAVPDSPNPAWTRNAIDAFIASEHKRAGLTPQVAADSPLLVKRLYIDLVGMPPSPAELLQWLGGDGSRPLDEETYQRLVQQLLDDGRHGERWGRHWMDIWRYSDWWGLGSQLRNSQQHMWHWRDWIIESLNADMPYDEMVRLMLAGDEIAPNDIQQLRATGYLARNFFLFNRHQWMDETVEHVGKSFLGLTMNCSKCHDHKYDPLPQTDYYRMRAFFEPYHVRLDMLPGESNYDRNALPRVFDAQLDAPTYLFVRGEENNPDKSNVLEPGIPEVLGFRDVEIKAVALPPEAWDTQRRPWVQEAFLANANQKVAQADAAIAKATKELQEADRQHVAMVAKAAENEARAKLAPDPNEPQPTSDANTGDSVVLDDFAELAENRWRLVDGQWSHEAGKLRQLMDGAQRAAARWLQPVPRDFDATVKFTTTGGSKWRSVGIAFDVDPQSDNTQSADDQQLHVYVSAVAGGAKVQAAYRQGGRDHYPSDAMRALPIELNRLYTLRVRVAGDLINVDLDGETVVVWRSPLARRDGTLQLTTFDALAEFDEFSLRPLDPSVPLKSPKADLSNPTTPQQTERLVAIASAKLRIAEQSKVVAKTELESLQHRIAAMVARWQRDEQNGSDPQGEATHRQAVLSQRAAKVAQEQLAIANLELQRLEAADDKVAAIDKQIAAQTEKLGQSIAAIDSAVSADEPIEPIQGAKWSATRFLNSGADDPQVDFPASSSGRRSALADWITDRNNPLTARVAVNHIWARHFGKPLVETVFDFGRNGASPTHPELLDWLAAELIDSGWSMKHIHRLVVSSSTYRMSSSNAGREHEMGVDTDNRYLWRRNPIRVESQVVRDSILSLADKIDLTRGGPSIPVAQQADSNRRSLYFFHSNNERNLFLTMFDEAAVKECYRRDESIVPQQALAMTNSRLVLDSIAPIAERLMQTAAGQPKSEDKSDSSIGPDDSDEEERFIKIAFLSLLGFAPSEQETSASRNALSQWKGLPNTSDSAARSYLVWTLLNHNDFVTLR